MGRIKIFVEDGETVESVENDLFKAISHHISGDAHNGESFEDPAMASVAEKMISAHDQMYKDMIKEINEELEKEHTK